MMKSTKFAVAVSTVLLALTTACSQSEQSEPSPNPSVSLTPPKVTAARPSRRLSKAVSPTPSAQPEKFQDGLDAGMSAATISQSAQSKDDWKLVVSRWQSAINLLKTVPQSSLNYTKAQQKISEYQRNLGYAQKQVNSPSKPKTTGLATPPVKMTSGQTSPSGVISEVSLAKHLNRIGAKLYGTYWCPYCNTQKKVFGEEAFRQINYIECDQAGPNPRPDLCKKANVSSYPTWEIKSQLYPGMRSLQELADLSGYRGDRNFQN